MRTLLATRYADPFTSVQRALQSFESLADTSALRVRLDVHEDDRAFHVTADLPGLNEKEVEVSFDEGVLTIRGEKKIAREEQGKTWHIAERSSGSFARTISLQTPIDINKIEAKFEKGVLTVALPKQPAPEKQTHRIEIKSVS